MLLLLLLLMWNVHRQITAFILVSGWTKKVKRELKGGVFSKLRQVLKLAKRNVKQLQIIFHQNLGIFLTNYLASHSKMKVLDPG